MIMPTRHAGAPRLIRHALMKRQPEDSEVLFEQYAPPGLTELQAKADEAMDRIRENQHWQDWLAIARFLAEGRRMAWEAAGRPKNNYNGNAYRRMFGRWLELHPKYNTKAIDITTRAHLFWCHDHAEAVSKWREALADNVRNNLNHPTAVKRRYEKENGKDKDAPPRTSPFEKLKAHLVDVEDQLMAAKKQIAELKSRQADGSLFDLHKDTAADLAEITFRHVGLARTRRLRDALTKLLKREEAAPRKTSKPAG
jgi:hypothetical protein